MGYRLSLQKFFQQQNNLFSDFLTLENKRKKRNRYINRPVTVIRDL